MRRGCKGRSVGKGPSGTTFKRSSKTRRRLLAGAPDILRMELSAASSGVTVAVRIASSFGARRPGAGLERVFLDTGQRVLDDLHSGRVHNYDRAVPVLDLKAHADAVVVVAGKRSDTSRRRDLDFGPVVNVARVALGAGGDRIDSRLSTRGSRRSRETSSTNVRRRRRRLISARRAASYARSASDSSSGRISACARRGLPVTRREASHLSVVCRVRSRRTSKAAIERRAAPPPSRLRTPARRLAAERRFKAAASGGARRTRASKPRLAAAAPAAAIREAARARASRSCQHTAPRRRKGGFVEAQAPLRRRDEHGAAARLGS